MREARLRALTHLLLITVDRISLQQVEMREARLRALTHNRNTNILNNNVEMREARSIIFTHLKSNRYYRSDQPQAENPAKQDFSYPVRIPYPERIEKNKFFSFCYSKGCS